MAQGSLNETDRDIGEFANLVANLMLNIRGVRWLIKNHPGDMIIPFAAHATLAGLFRIDQAKYFVRRYIEILQEGGCV